MSFSFPRYAQVRDRYCISYLGNYEVFITQLCKVRPYIESNFPNLELHICCRDDFFYVLEGEPNVIKYSDWKNNKRNYAYTRELKYNMKTNPVADLLQESDLDLPEWLKNNN